MTTKERTSWDGDAIEIFLDLLKENKKARGGKYNWDTIVLRLNAQTGKEFEKKQLENFFSDIRTKYKAWNELKSWTGIGWDEKTGCPIIDPKDEKWKAFKKRFKNAASLLKTPLMFEDKLNDIFLGTYATTNKSWSPTVGGPTIPIQTKNKQPILIQDQSMEGSGDSEEELRNEDDSVENGERSGYESKSPPKTTSSNKRKSSDSGATSSKKSTSVKADIETCMDYLRRNMQLGSSKTQSTPPPSKYEKMIAILEGMPAVSNYGKSFILQVLEFLRDPDESDFFLSLPDNEFRIMYLKKKIQFPDDCYRPTFDDNLDDY